MKTLGMNLADARRKKGLTQEAVAEKLGVSRQTVSKWETGESLPDIRQAKRLSQLYSMTLDELVDFDLELKGIEEAIDRIDEEKEERIDWTKAWSRRYPILASYHALPGIAGFRKAVEELCKEVQTRYSISTLDTFLVVKDLVYQVYKDWKRA